MPAKVISIKTKSQVFDDWLREVVEANKLHGQTAPESAVLLWEKKDETGRSWAYHARFNSGLEELDWFSECLDDAVLDLKIGEFLKKHIQDYLQYI